MDLLAFCSDSLITLFPSPGRAIMHSLILSSIFDIAVYAPIALFAETLCVQHALVASILSIRSIAPGITGCVKDLRRLWHLDHAQLLAHFVDRVRRLCQARQLLSLHNQTVLLLASALRRTLGAASAP